MAIDPRRLLEDITRKTPTCFLFLVDQSGSMNMPFGANPEKKKSEGVADALNRLLQALVFRCSKGDSVLDRYYIGLIGYGSTANVAFGGDLAGMGLVPVSQIAAHPLRVETRVKKVDDGAGGLIDHTVKLPIYYAAVANGETHMCEALQMAQEMIVDFVKTYPACFPPIVINISDGKATDGNPEPLAAAVQEEALVFNAHISSLNEKPILFPVDEESLPDAFARLLFRMSSVMPPQMVQTARSLEIQIPDGARGFVFNGDLVSVIHLLQIGTQVDKNAGR